MVSSRHPATVRIGSVALLRATAGIVFASMAMIEMTYSSPTTGIPHRGDTFSRVRDAPSSPAVAVLRQETLWFRGPHGSPSADGNVSLYRVPAIVALPPPSSGGGSHGVLLAFTGTRHPTATDKTASAAILMRRSLDGGASWGRTVHVVGDPLAIGPTADMMAPIVSSFRGSQQEGGAVPSTVVLPFQQSNDPNCFVGQTTSVDAGDTWTAPVCLDRFLPPQMRRDASLSPGPSSGLTIMWPNNTTSSGRERLMFSVHHTFGEAACLYSTDGGSTWAASRNASGGLVFPDVSECALASLPNGSVVMNCRHPDGEPQPRAISISHDGGASFSAFWMDNAITSAQCQGSLVMVLPQPPSNGSGDKTSSGIRSTATGSALLYLNDRVSQAHLRANMILMRSNDSGATWGIATQLWANESAYSSLAVLPTTMHNYGLTRGEMLQRPLHGMAKDALAPPDSAPSFALVAALYNRGNLDDHYRNITFALIRIDF